MTPEQLAEARALASSPRLAGGSEYQRSTLAVLLDLRDIGTALLDRMAPPVAVAPPVSVPAPTTPKRGR